MMLGNYQYDMSSMRSIRAKLPAGFFPAVRHQRLCADLATLAVWFFVCSAVCASPQSNFHPTEGWLPVDEITPDEARSGEVTQTGTLPSTCTEMGAL